MKIKIGILTERMRFGFGVDLVVDEQARRLVELGFDVTVVVLHADTTQPSRPYRLIVLNRHMTLGGVETAHFIEHVIFKFDLEDTDLWILQTPPFYSWLDHLRAPAIFVEHGTPPGDFFTPDVGGAIDRQAHGRLAGLYSRLAPFDRIVSISRSIKDWLPSAARQSSVIIHNGCDHYRSVAADEARNFRRSLGVDDAECLILWVGRMQLDNDEQPYKGLQELLSLIPLLQRNISKARFALVGKVSNRDQRRLEKRGVMVLANQSAEGMARCYSSADLLLNVSKWEGFNLALLEAQFQGTPVIAYDIGPHSEIVRHGETGFLAKNEKELFDKVVELASDRVLRERLGRQAVEFARGFSWDGNVAQLVELIKVCMAAAPPRAQVEQVRRTISGAGIISTIAATQTTLSAQELLRLGKRRFVQQAGALLLADDTSIEVEAHWLPKVRNGADKRAILLEMAEVGRQFKTARQVAGLGRELTLARIEKLRCKFLARLGLVDALPSSPWTWLQNDAFLSHASRVILGHTMEQQTRAEWLDRLRAGTQRNEVLAQLLSSTEIRNRSYVERQLPATLKSGHQNSTAALKKRRNTPAAAAGFISSILSGGLPDLRRFLRRPATPRALAVDNFERIHTKLHQVASNLEVVGQAIAKMEQGLHRGAPPTCSPSIIEQPACGVSPNLAHEMANGLHRVLIAPSASLDRASLNRLMQAAQDSGSDLIFGDEHQRVDRPPYRVAIRRGRFSHAAFLGAPDLGGAIAVRTDLLDNLGLSYDVALTGAVLLRLVAHAHTITYVPVCFSERTRVDFTADCATLADVQAYARQIRRRSRVVADGSTAFEVRFPPPIRWTAAVIVIDSGLVDGEARASALHRLRAHTQLDRVHFVLVDKDSELDEGSQPSMTTDQGTTRITFPAGTTYAKLVNESVARLPRHDSLLVIMDSGVSPERDDWLDRLAETALAADVGAVSPITIYPDGRIRHAGMASNELSCCNYTARFFPLNNTQDGFGPLHALREVSLISHHCMVIRRSVFLDQGGFVDTLDAEAADIELCCRLRLADLAILVDGKVVMTAPDPLPRWRRSIPREELDLLRSRHAHLLGMPDQFWAPPGAEALKGDEVMTTYLPPLAER